MRNGHDFLSSTVMGPTKRMREIREAIPWTVVGLYIAVHLATLAWFPFVHSDEAWLSSLTRTMIVERSVES